jgi:tetratricopeptide (TPR) repeat protein
MPHSRIRVLALCVLVLTASAHTNSRLAAQAADASDAAIQKRLDSVRSDLFTRPERVKESVRELKEILALDPRSAEGHLLLGIAYRTLGSADMMAEATAELRQALALNPAFVHAHYYLARIYLDLGRAQRAHDELEAALQQVPHQPQFLALLGETERQLGNAQRALDIAQQALTADGNLTEARYYLARAMLDLKRRDDAIRELEQVARSGAQVADVYLWLGTAYQDAGRIDMALNSLGEAARIEPARSDIRIRLARAYRTKGLLAKAEEQLTLAAPKAGDAQATSSYQQQQSDWYVERGLLSVKQNRPAEAIDAFKKALDVDPNSGPAHRHLAETYLQQGSYALARQHAASAAKLGFPLAADKRKLLQEKLPQMEAPRR